MQSDQPSIQFLLEPPHRIEFSNSTGTRLDCSANGNPQPQIEWITADGSPATAVAGLRRALPNGSLELAAFAGARYRRDVHAAVYRCRARSAAGLVLSRECHVNAVITLPYEVKVYDEYVMAGNSGVLRCAVPAHAAARVAVAAWLQDGALAIYPDSDIGGKYTMLHGGELHISSANQADGFIAFSCRTQDRLTGEVQTSTYPGHVILTEPKGSVQPRATLEKHSARRAAVGERVLLACVAQGWPVPTYRWFKEHRDQLVGLESSERMTVTSSGLLRIAKVRLEDHGKYLCWVNNTAGEETIQITLTVTAPLTIHITPAVQTVDVGADAALTCNARGWPAPRVRWLQEGAPRGDSTRLELRALAREHAGLYQCVAANEWEQMVDVAEVRLGDTRPELVNWFSEQTMQAGPALSLKCVATGSPPPHFTWSLDGFSLPDNTRFVVGQHVTAHDDVVSHLNMSRVTEQDGGEFACVASNTAGRARHAERVNVYGPPYIREMPRLTIVAGRDLIVKCPVAGYPIESITWERDGQLLPLNRRQRVFPNGTLQVEQVQRAEDAGTYTCQAANRQRHAARRDVEVLVIVQPKILPIQPMTNLLREGMRAAISCQILEGDLPITFKWEKDGEPVLPSSYGGAGAGIITRRLDEYSTSLLIETVASAHSGNYTCVASNVAGTERFTVPLTVNVPPRWTTEPTDASAAAGQDVALDCQADGYPAPTIAWKKAVGMAPGEYKDFLFEPNVSLYPNGSLIFFRVTKDSESHYLCEARNNIGTGVSKVIFLKVNAPARFPTKSKTLQVVAKEQAHLQCTATGDNPIDINWRSPHHHSLANHLDQRYTIREQILDDGMVSELGIMHAYRQDTGTLTCTASNAYGHDEMTIQLVVQEEPEMPKNIRIIDQQSRSILISWTQPYAGNSPIINYIVQYKSGADSWITNPAKVIVPGSLTTATVQNLHPARSYHLRIIAENRLGQSEPSQVIQVTTLEEVPGGPPLDIRAEPKSSTELTVTWEPPQRDLWNGNILGYYIGYQEVLPNSTHLLATAFLSTSTQLPTQSHAYTVKTVEAGAHGNSEASLGGLERYTSYAVIVQAYNSRGAGPASLPITTVTMEDAPSLPPDNVHCSVLSSQSIRVSWEMPPSRGRNGVIQGYKVSHTPMQEWYGKDEQVTKQITGLRTTLSGLRRYTNYSVSVAAFTNAGDGVKSPPVYCHTEEDVPSTPADIKAVVSSMNKILVSWLPPEHPNGILVGYTFYMSIIEDGREEGTHKRILSPNTGSHETVRTQEEATHQFWLTASTRVGEGESTRVVTILPSDKVPARITSFSREIITPWKENVTLPCNKVGIPHPSTTWSLQGNVLEPSPRKNITSEGILIISMTQYADSGNYTCIVENSHGRDDITYNVHVKVPPQPPILAVVDSYADSLHLQWTDQGDGGSPILGYVINYKREHGDWEELQVEAGTMEHVLPNLWCGTRYQLYITAFNKIGTGLPCDIVNAFTKGTVPVKPKHSQMITLNTTVVTVWLDSWGDGGCGILYFVIEYREQSHSQWRLVSNSVQATERVFSVTGLSPAKQYQLKITAHNNAGFAVALYNFTTHSFIGGHEPKLSPPVSHSGNGDRTFYGGARVLLPASLSLLVLAALIAIVFLVRRNKVTQCGAVGARGVGESPSAAQLQNKVNRDAQYLAARGRQPVPVGVEDTLPYKSEANEYMEDICPYATFQLSKPTAYSESSYSGNVYSGPYHSVRGSFVYHDVKQSDKYKSGHSKEPEYTKVRRKGSRLRDPHSESQESDNLGSTDSEVKKILTLHLPITEYEDDGTDEGSGPGSESEGASHRPRRHAAPAPTFAPEESSSSSETSPGGVVRKAFPSRKGKAGLQSKRHVRSSSGYSSHNDETTFSISNYPSFNEHIHPPSRFSDGTECDTSLHHRRKRALLSHTQNDGKLTREAFQINV